MKFLSTLFRRKPPTPKQARAILDSAIRQTLDNGLTGYVVGLLSDGKKAAGRILDGRTWDEFPEARTA